MRAKLTLRVVLPLKKRDFWTATIGSWSIIAPKPYPRNFLVMQLMINSWKTELTKKVMSMATGWEKRDREGK
jgi:hypothetical protein